MLHVLLIFTEIKLSFLKNLQKWKVSFKLVIFKLCSQALHIHPLSFWRILNKTVNLYAFTKSNQHKLMLNTEISTICWWNLKLVFQAETSLGVKLISH